ncbi:hypothetical protein K0M31_009315, partial [Melipona bicolor]
MLLSRSTGLNWDSAAISSGCFNYTKMRDEHDDSQACDAENRVVHDQEPRFQKGGYRKFSHNKRIS